MRPHDPGATGHNVTGADRALIAKRAGRPYHGRVRSLAPAPSQPAAAAEGGTPQRRRPATGGEQERRKAWGAFWGLVGAQVKREIEGGS